MMMARKNEEEHLTSSDWSSSRKSVAGIGW